MENKAQARDQRSGTFIKAGEKTLDDPLTLLQLIMENIPQAVFWKDKNCVYVYCNHNFAVDAGVESPKAIRGKTDYDLAWTPEEAAEFRRWDKLVMDSGKPRYHIIEPQRQADGKQAWLETNKVPIFDENGDVVGILGTYEDITERKNAEEALRSSQQMLRLILDNIPQAVFWKNRDSVYLGCNYNFANDAGVGSPENLVGKTDYDLAWNEEQATAFRNWDQQVIDTGKPQYHIIEPQHQADGKQAWLDTNKVPLYDADGNTVGILGTYEDITERILAKEELEKAHAELELRVEERTAELTQSNLLLRQEIEERKRVEDELRISRERYTQAVKAGRVVVWDWDLSTHHFYIDPNFTNILDIHPNEIPNTIDGWVNFAHPDDRLGVANAIKLHLDGISSIFEHEYRLIGGKKETHWVLSRGTVIRDDSGNPLRMTGSTTDITELTLTEEALRGRDTILVSLAYASQKLLDLNRLYQSLPEVLSQLGKAVGVSNAYLCKNSSLADGALLGTIEYQWSSPAGLYPEENVSTNLDYHKLGLDRWVDLLSNGECISGSRSEFVVGEQSYLRDQKIRSIALVPIISDGSWWGSLGLVDRYQERSWSPGVIGALKSTASALGAAFTQKRSQEAEREQRVLAEALMETSSLLNSTLKIEEVLDRILLAIGYVVPHDMANIVLVEGDRGYSARPNRELEGRWSDNQDVPQTFLLSERPPLQYMLNTRQPLIIADTESDRDWTKTHSTEKVRSYLGAPIEFNGEVIGFTNLNSYHENFFTPVHAERLKAFATQAAIAINNARLYERAQELAALEERQRLARDLHDAVSQTLWTANLIAEVLPDLWSRDPADGQQSLQKLSKLIGGALAEMRTLLLELRPAALMEAKLEDLLCQLAEATMSRKRINIRLVNEGICEVPQEVKLVYYRIAQEALNNIIKHSRATQADITLRCQQGMAVLTIQDNGRGFEHQKPSTGRLGLRIIHERASSIDATVKIRSQLDRGTELKVTWPMQGKA